MSAVEANAERAPIGWGRALVTGVVIVAIGLAASVGGADAVLKRATALSREVREYVASTVFFVAVIAVAWVLRRLQARGVI